MFVGQQLGNLNGVGCGAFAKVVADAPERDSVFRADVLADSTDEDIVLAVAITRHGISRRLLPKARELLRQ